MSLSKVDQAISVIKFQTKRREQKIKEQERRLDLNENQKIWIGHEYEFLRAVKTLVDEIFDSMQKNLGRILPADRDLEESILGALILEKNALEMVVGFLKPEHFYTNAHSEIYAEILRLHVKHDPVDLHTLVHQLRVAGKLELVGGPVYIASLSAKVSSSANIQTHARIVLEFAIKRQLILMSSQIHQEGYDDQKDCFDVLDFAENQIKEIRSWVIKK